MPPFRALAAAAALTLCVGCSMPAETAAPPAVATIAVPCAETVATPSGSRPPVLAGTTSSWFGHGDLWVGLPDYSPVAQGNALVLKFPWVTLADRTPTAALGAPVVAARRTDAPGDALGEIGAFARAFGTGELSFWPATVQFPAAGCWTVSGVLGSAAVEFVLSVEQP